MRTVSFPITGLTCSNVYPLYRWIPDKVETHVYPDLSVMILLVPLFNNPCSNVIVDTLHLLIERSCDRTLRNAAKRINIKMQQIAFMLVNAGMELILQIKYCF